MRGESNFSDVGVLCRYNSDRRAITDALIGAGIPVVGCIGEERPQDWRHALAVLNVLANPSNVFAVAHLATFKGWDFGEALQLSITDSTAGRNISPLMKWDTSSPFRVLMDEGISEGTRRLIFAIAQKAGLSDSASLAELMIALRTDGEPLRIEEGVAVLTYHGAKGQEWGHVYLPASEERNLGKKDPDELAEERRCYFVAVTRAMASVHVSWANTRDNPHSGRIEPTGDRSRFVVELAPL